MNEAQTIYTFFFALYYTHITSATVKLHPYDTPSMWLGNRKALLRFIVSNIILNLLPLLFFWWTIDTLVDTDFQVFNTLCKEKGVHIKYLDSFWNLVAIVFFSMIGQGFYRFYYGLMLCRNEQEQYRFYDFELYNHENSNHPKNITKPVKSKRFGKFANFSLVSNTCSITNVYLKENVQPSGLPKSLASDLATRPVSHRKPIVHIGPGILWIILTSLLLGVFAGLNPLWFWTPVIILLLICFFHACIKRQIQKIKASSHN